MTSIKDFQIITKLGEGAYSSVYKVKRLTDSQEYALKKVKLMNLSEKEKLNALNEVRILASVRHPNIIAYKEAFIEENSNSLCIVMEYANNGDLFQKIVEHQKKGTTFSEVEIWNYFIQMTKALKSLHDFKIFHRDLKSANVFLNKDGTVKLGDMNVSKVAKKGLLYTQTGTPYYASPEVWRDMPYDQKSDVWSLGCVLYEITTLKPPFRAEDMEGLYKKVLRGYYPRVPTHYSQDLSNIIRALLQVSPHLRPSCDRILQLPALVKKIEEKHMTEIDEDEQQIQLLNTIRIPKNLHFLTERLPKANYAPLRTKKVDKSKFLQTLAGYKDSSDVGLLNEAIKGSESVDAYKAKEKDPSKVYLPPLAAKDLQHSKDIMKIYGGSKEKEGRKEPAAGSTKMSGARASAGAGDEEFADADLVAPRKPPVDAKKKRTSAEEIVEGSSRNNRSREKEVERNRQQVHQQQQPKVAYKVKDLNQDVVFEEGVGSRVSVGGKAPAKHEDSHSSKESIHAMIKRNKNRNPLKSPSQEFVDLYDDASPKKLATKLPALGSVSIPKKYSELPPLLEGQKGYVPSASPKKANKLKELSKVYKVNVGNFDDIMEKYSSAASKVSRKEKVKSGLEYGINGVKYGKGYDLY